MADNNGNGKCGCIKGPSPWEPVSVLNGDGSSEFELFEKDSPIYVQSTPTDGWFGEWKDGAAYDEHILSRR